MMRKDEDQGIPVRARRYAADFAAALLLRNVMAVLPADVRRRAIRAHNLAIDRHARIWRSIFTKDGHRRKRAYRPPTQKEKDAAFKRTKFFKQRKRIRGHRLPLRYTLPLVRLKSGARIPLAAGLDHHLSDAEVSDYCNTPLPVTIWINGKQKIAHLPLTVSARSLAWHMGTNPIPTRIAPDGKTKTKGLGQTGERLTFGVALMRYSVERWGQTIGEEVCQDALRDICITAESDGRRKRIIFPSDLRRYDRRIKIVRAPKKPSCRSYRAYWQWLLECLFTAYRSRSALSKVLPDNYDPDASIKRTPAYYDDY